MCSYVYLLLKNVFRLGGVNGYGTQILLPGGTAKVPLPLAAFSQRPNMNFVWLKVYKPKLPFDKELYVTKVSRGQMVELGQEECTIRARVTHNQ